MSALFGPLVLLWALGAGIAIGVRWLEWRHTRYALADDILFVESGWWRRRRAIVPRRKVQSVELAENFWSRAFGICALRLGVAGGGGFSAHIVPALGRSDAERLRQQLLVSA